MPNESLSLRRIYRLNEDPRAKKAFKDIIQRGLEGADENEKAYGDALMKAVDQFDIEVRPATQTRSSERPGSDKKAATSDKEKAQADKERQAKADKKAKQPAPKPAAKKDEPKPAAKKEPEEDDLFSSFKDAGPLKKEPQPAPKAPAKDVDLDDPWFKDDEKPAARGPAPKARPADDDFPDLPAPKSANFQVGGEDEEDGYRSPFGHLPGFSSWDKVPDWMRDPESMPRVGGGSMPIPGSKERQPQDGPAPSRPGLLGRLFGRRKK